MTKPPANKWIALLLLIVAYTLIYNPWTKFPYTFCCIIIFILAATYFQDRSLKNLHFKKIGIPELKTILFCYILLEVSMDFVVQPLISLIFNEPADYSSFDSIKGNTGLYLKWLWRMWISAAIGEELLFRGFVFAQGKKIIGERNKILIPVSAILFALPHLYQGISGLLVTFIFGLAFAWIYARYKNIWINIIIHGLVDTVFLTLSYYGKTTEFYSLFGWLN